MTIGFKSVALKFIEKQPKNQQKRLIEAINRLPNCNDIKKLTGIKKKTLYRLRVRKLSNYLFSRQFKSYYNYFH